MPVFEDLLDEPYNTAVLDLLWTLSNWHALAKLRLHTDATLNLLSQYTAHLGKALRQFQRETCSHFTTKELPREEAARGRRQAKKNAQRGSATSAATSSRAISAAKLKSLNLFTYKLHSLGDYVRSIRWFGTSDSYSTQPVSFW